MITDQSVEQLHSKTDNEIQLHQTFCTILPKDRMLSKLSNTKLNLAIRVFLRGLSNKVPLTIEHPCQKLCRDDAESTDNDVMMGITSMSMDGFDGEGAPRRAWHHGVRE